MYKTYSYILSENVAGYGTGNRKPSGYCKIRCLEDKNMVDVNIRNIDTDRNKYNCYLIYFKDKYYGVNIGEATVLGENSITLKKDIQARGKMHNCDLKGFAITCEREDTKAILYGCNDESDFWDGHFMKDEELEEDKVYDNEEVKEEMKEEAKEEMKEEIEKIKEIKEIKEKTNDDIKEKMQNITQYEMIDENMENSHIGEKSFDENLHQKINIDDLIHMDRFSWAIFNNIFLYISYKKYGFVFYKQEPQKCSLFIPVEEKYIINVKHRYQYIEAHDKEYQGYIMLEW
ncbi:MAG: hypothetical protein A2Y22_05465 [Clostridiales bacterium GWD2_32_59]|nr:MAG: hypothetical protein A2Y22_05465 [Clostridiales bacterium GWD2_32_59]